MAAADETLRLRRRVAEGGPGPAPEAPTLELTYKGPRQPSDAKVRAEANLPLASDPTPLLLGLGFQPGPRLRKRREDWDLDGLCVALDELAGVGTFVEVEALGDDPTAASRRVEAGVARLALDATRVAEPYIELARRRGALV